MKKYMLSMNWVSPKYYLESKVPFFTKNLFITLFNVCVIAINTANATGIRTETFYSGEMIEGSEL